MSEFRRACVSEFGAQYAPILLRDHWLTVLGGTADEAIARGVAPRAVWDALCVDLDVPKSRRHGRGLPDPKS